MTSQAEDYKSHVCCGSQNHVPMYGWSVGTPLLSADAFLQLQVRTASLGWQSHSRLGPAGQSKGALSRATAGRDPKANQKCSFAESWAGVQPLSAKTLLWCIIHLFIIVYWTCEILLKRRPDNWSSTKPRATSLERNGSLQRVLPFVVVSDHAATIFLSLIVTESTTLTILTAKTESKCLGCFTLYVAANVGAGCVLCSPLNPPAKPVLPWPLPAFFYYWGAPGLWVSMMVLGGAEWGKSKWLGTGE